MSRQIDIQADGTPIITGTTIEQSDDLINPWISLPLTLGTNITHYPNEPLKVLYNSKSRLLNIKGAITVPSTSTSSGYTLATVDYSSIPTEVMNNYTTNTGTILISVNADSGIHTIGLIVIRKTGVFNAYTSDGGALQGAITPGLWFFQNVIGLG
jgi:hypothetical protein